MMPDNDESVRTIQGALDTIGPREREPWRTASEADSRRSGRD